MRSKNRTWQSETVRAFVDAVGYTNPVEAVLYRARELLRRSRQTEPPFHPERLACAMGIEVIEVDLGRLDACLVPNSGSYIIKVNAKHPRERRNFSCAHEIAHTFFLEANPSVRARKTNPLIGLVKQCHEEERLCNIAAAEMLMPLPAFRRAVGAFGLSVSSIEPLATLFAVSIRATAIRLAETSLEPCVLLCWKPMDLLDWQAKLRIAWSAQQITEAGRFRYFIPRLKSANALSSVLRAYEGQNTASRFETVKLGDLNGCYYIESKAFGSGRTRYVISIIFPERKGVI